MKKGKYKYFSQVTNLVSDIICRGNLLTLREKEENTDEIKSIWRRKIWRENKCCCIRLKEG